MLGEFYSGSGTAWFLVGECCVAVAPSVCPVVGVLPPTRAHPVPPVPTVPPVPPVPTGPLRSHLCPPGPSALVLPGVPQFRM